MFASANLAQSATAESKHKEACATIAEKNESHMVRLDHVLLFFSVQLIVVSVAGAVEKNEASSCAHGHAAAPQKRPVAHPHPPLGRLGGGLLFRLDTLQRPRIADVLY